MIEFNFRLDDQEAETFISILRDEAVRCRARAIEEDPSEKDWHNRHALFIDQMTEKILAGNAKVDGY